MVTGTIATTNTTSTVFRRWNGTAWNAVVVAAGIDVGAVAARVAAAGVGVGVGAARVATGVGDAGDDAGEAICASAERDALGVGVGVGGGGSVHTGRVGATVAEVVGVGVGVGVGDAVGHCPPPSPTPRSVPPPTPTVIVSPPQTVIVTEAAGESADAGVVAASARPTGNAITAAQTPAATSVCRPRT